ncbi:2-heptyl-3-hydroxy-4(1H)-quinolone synthase [Candidatus Phycosocius bacilliformis]|uniref:2-heptyl-3-hydroxy-4(1H)-quinolone synthase n=1 Tax=Candidatus Phycosocius bacilliformis TaxID=1445552 RepID=A0A2P2E895_9PROT|nr:NAD(P)/FAD-dependent oxidoreductase [Candidatus Phycosocius bacilliformis]GBF57289.1 2-heptyl-3-hydroxy-4(1H)-quinolone synthase [Candidatus Phycosocius bacilliformis]
MARIAIAGCGIGGLACAIFLHEQGHHVCLVERFATPSPLGSGLLLQPTGQAVLARLGLLAPVQAAGARIDRLFGSVAHSNRTIFDLGYDQLGRGRYGIGVHRASLFQALWKRVQDLSIEVKADTHICGRAHVGTQQFLVTQTQERLGPFELVIDASGSHSDLAISAGAPMPKPFRYGAVWASPINTTAITNTLTQRYVKAHTMIGILPIGQIPGDLRPHIAFFWSLKPEDHAAWVANFEGWKRHVADLWPEIADVLAQFHQASDLTLARYGQRTLARPFCEGMVHIGDAAHQTSPQLGQGANSALLDAAILADCIACYGIEDAGAKFGRARANPIRFYQAASWLLTPFFQSDSDLLAHLRDALFQPLAAIPFFRSEMARTLGGLKTGLLRSATPDRLAHLAVQDGRPLPQTRSP